ncbi:MAG TPA: methionyl-tRNA formyltransferase [bacterium]|nr:methionyl-tRNA formyltransferase [bacterium]
MKIVFFGTPAFAVPSLDAVLAVGEVVAAVTRADKPRGRGLHVEPPPIARAASEYALEVLQPASLRDPVFLARLRALAPDVGVLVAYGRLVPPEVLAIPPHGIVNVHPSLLPRYRGAAPVARAVAAGDAETGVTILHLSEELDAGDIILQKTVPIGPEDTTGTLTARLAEEGAVLLAEALRLIETGRAPRLPQDHARATWAPRLAREEGQIDWRRPAAAIVNLVRACDPWPGAFTHLGGHELKIWRARVMAADGGVRRPSAAGQAAPGTVLSVPADDRAPLGVAAGEGVVHVHEVQPAAGRRMSAAAYARGHALEPGVTLGGDASRESA